MGTYFTGKNQNLAYSFEGWQIRVHKVELDTEYVLYETGFAIECSPEKEGIIIEEDKENYRVSEAGFSGIICLSDDTIKRKSTAIMGLPNTNLMTWENTFIPGLEGTFGKRNPLARNRSGCSSRSGL